MKTYFWHILALLTFSYAQAPAQSISSSTASALNAYTEVANKQIDELTKGMECLSKFYRASLIYKEKQTDNFRSFKSSCIDHIDEYYLKKVGEKSTKLGASDRQSLNKHYNEMLGIYTDIVEKCREIEAYVNLQDYKSDTETSWSANKLAEIQKGYEDFKVAKRNLDKAINTVYRKHHPYNYRDKNQFAEQQMRNALKIEWDMMDNWSYNLNPNVTTNSMPSADLIKNINQIDSMFQWTEIPKINLHYKNFVNQIYNRAQKTKRYWLDRNIYKNQLNDNHHNSGYKAFLSELNKGSLSFFNHFCTENSNYRGIALTGYVPSFSIPNEPATIEPTPVKYSEINVQQLNATKKDNYITPQEAYALNSYIEFVNNAVRVSSNIPRVCDSYNHSFNRAIEDQRKPSRFHHDYADMPLSYYQSAIFNSKYISKTYQNTLNSQAHQIWEVFEELRHSLKQLELVTYEKSDIEPSYDFIEERLKRISHLIDQFNLQTDNLYNNVKAIYESYPKESNAWVKTGMAMTALMDEDRKIVESMYKYLRDSSGTLPSLKNLNAIAREAYLNKHDNLDGIDTRKYGTSSSSIERYYNGVIDDSKKIGELSQLGYDANKYSGRRGNSPAYAYKEFIYKYNHLAEYYFNKIVEIPDAEKPVSEFFNPYLNFEPVSLLKHQLKLNFYAFSPPPPPAVEEKPVVEETSENVDELYVSMDGFAVNHLVLLLDVSSSMKNENKLPLLKKSLKRLLSIMREEDKLSIVIYSADAKAVLKGVSCKSRKVIKELDRLSSSGTTNIKEGIELAYKMADKYHIEGGNNRIILATDGQFNLASSLYELIEEKAGSDIAMSVFYYGNKNIMPEKMVKMANAGKGKFSHVTTENTDLVLVKEAKAKRAVKSE